MADKIPQTVDEFEKHLSEHIYFMKASARSFDHGFESEAKRLAVSLRVLLHDTPKSVSLLAQLGKKNIPFLDTSSRFNPNNFLTFHGLISLQGSASGVGYIPYLDDPPHAFTQEIDFEKWWNAVVIADKKGNKLSRRDLVLAVANQDGGAHVDPGLNEVYANLSRHNSLGWYYENPSGQQAPNGAELASIRQIAYEVLRSLEIKSKKKRQHHKRKSP